MVGHWPASEDVLSCDLAETMAELCILDVYDLADMAQSAPSLSQDAAGMAV
jgi:hypothetical protein